MGRNEILLLLAVLLLHVSSHGATCRSIVRFLPGFEGPLPFVLETGYIGVGEKEDVQLFYYFVESQNNPKDDPLMLWLTGGPGCSAFLGLVFEIGPLTFKIEEYNGSLPNLVLRHNSWTKVSSIIFLDLPVGTGFSYSKTGNVTEQGDWAAIHQAHQFFRKWLIDHPEFLSNKVYIGGDSFSGIPLPVIVDEISKANENGVQPLINLQGYVLGNPVTVNVLANPNPVKWNISEAIYGITFAHGKGLISDELYESVQKNCGEEYQSKDPENCSRDIQSYVNSVSALNLALILEPTCASDLPKPFEISWRRRSLTYKPKTFLKYQFSLSPLRCRSTYGHNLCHHWANDDNVRKALQIRKGSTGRWLECKHFKNYKYEIHRSFQYHMNLSRKGYRSLIYSGDHDLLVPFLETQAWIRSLNYSIVDDWRQWYSNGQIAGYTRTYSNQMTFATVKGGGHTAAEHKFEACFDMFNRWISHTPL